MIVGEIWNYPEKWLKSIDGVMNFTLREIIYRTIRQQISTQMALKMIKEMIDDAGIEPILKSWNVLDNHDVKRLLTEIKHPKDQKIAQLMQFTLPGSPNLYYGTELGMDGDNDPENRAPMRWDMLLHDNSIYSWTKKLIELHQTYRALKIGDFKPLITNQLFAFERYTDCVEDTIIVVINTTDDKISESMMIKDSNIMNYSGFDILLGESKKIECLAGFLKVELESKSFVVFKPKVKPDKSYTPYKRI
jgi:glycosidase